MITKTNIFNHSNWQRCRKLLRAKDYNANEIKVYKKAFLFFALNPKLIWMQCCTIIIIAITMFVPISQPNGKRIGFLQKEWSVKRKAFIVLMVDL